MRKVWLLPTFFALLCIQDVRAENMGAYSVEWLTVSSKVVAVGTILDVEKVKGPFAVVYETYTFQPSIVAKGNKVSRFKFTIRSFSTEPFSFEVNDEVIVFLSDYAENEDFLRNKLVPTTDQFPLSAAKAIMPGKYFISTDFEVLKNSEEILAVAKHTVVAENNYLKNHDKSSIKRFYLRIPMDKPAFRNLYAGSDTFLFVPNFISSDATEKLY